MGSGAKRKKRQGHRPSSRVRKPKLSFLVDHHITTSVRLAVNRVPGYTSIRLQDISLERSKDQLGVKDEAVKRNMVILTADSEFSDPVNFRICTHPGVLWIHMSSQTEAHIVPRLKSFLTSPNYAKCKHAIVELRDYVAFVTSASGQEQIHYYAVPAP